MPRRPSETGLEPAGCRPPEILDGLRRGDSDAVASLRALVLRHLRIALRHRGVAEPDMDDLVQDATIRVLDRLDGYRGDAAFSTWVAVVSVRSALTALRRRRGRRDQGVPATPVPECISLHTGPIQGAISREVREYLLAAIECELTDRQREVIVDELKGVPQVCIADRLGVSVNAVYKMSHDARRKLRDALIDRGLGGETDRPRPVLGRRSST